MPSKKALRAHIEAEHPDHPGLKPLFPAGAKIILMGTEARPFLTVRLGTLILAPLILLVILGVPAAIFDTHKQKEQNEYILDLIENQYTITNVAHEQPNWIKHLGDRDLGREICKSVGPRSPTYTGTVDSQRVTFHATVRSCAKGANPELDLIVDEPSELDPDSLRRDTG